jgi:hypothetical protein
MKDEREARMVEFFVGPLSSEERVLRDVLCDACARYGGVAARLTPFLSSDPKVGNAWKDCKSLWMQLNPPVEASFVRWVELRMLQEVRISREPYIRLTREEMDRRGLGKGLGKRRASQDVGQEHPSKIRRLGGDVNSTPLGHQLGKFGTSAIKPFSKKGAGKGKHNRVGPSSRP